MATKWIRSLFLLWILVLTSRAAEMPPLKEAFKDHFLVGAALTARVFSEQDSAATQLVALQFSSVTSENVLKWNHVHPRENGYDFSQADQFVRFGAKHGMFIVGHTLIWHEQTPSWVFEKEGKPVDREMLLKRMRDHIQTVVGHYRGRIGGWDVVNEALEGSGNLRKSKWLQIIGPDYIQKAFEYARQADPAAELYYNDYGLEHRSKRQGALNLIRELQSNGIKVHAVGLQGHYNMERPEPDQLQETIDAFAALNVKCMITELDVDLLPSARGGSADVSFRQESRASLNPYPDHLPDAVQSALAKRYGELFEVFVKNSNMIDRVAFWGVTDRDSWLNNWPVRGRSNYPLLFDREGNPKPAFKAVVRTAR